MGLVLIELKRGDRVAAEKVRTVQLYESLSVINKDKHVYKSVNQGFHIVRRSLCLRVIS